MSCVMPDLTTDDLRDQRPVWCADEECDAHTVIPCANPACDQEAPCEVRWVSVYCGRCQDDLDDGTAGIYGGRYVVHAGHE